MLLGKDVLKIAVNLQENTHAKVRFQKSFYFCKKALLKMFDMIRNTHLEWESQQKKKKKIIELSNCEYMRPFLTKQF